MLYPEVPKLWSFHNKIFREPPAGGGHKWKQKRYKTGPIRYCVSLTVPTTSDNIYSWKNSQITWEMVPLHSIISRQKSTIFQTSYLTSLITIETLQRTVLDWFSINQELDDTEARVPHVLKSIFKDIQPSGSY